MDFIKKTSTVLAIFSLLISFFAISATAELIEEEVEGEGGGAFTAPEGGVPEGQTFSFNFDVTVDLTLKIDGKSKTFNGVGGNINVSWATELTKGTYTITEIYHVLGIPDSDYLEGDINITKTIQREVEALEDSGYEIIVDAEITDLEAFVEGDFEGETVLDGILPNQIPMSLVSQDDFDEGDAISYEAEYVGLIASDVTLSAVTLPPVINSLSIEVEGGEPALSTSTLKAILDAEDPEDGPLGPDAATFTWLKNGSPIAGATGQTLSGKFVKGDKIQVKAVVTDSGGKKSEPFTSDPIEIQNTPPPTADIKLSPDSPTTSDTINLNITPKKDADGDPVEQNIKWSIDGQPQPNLDGKSKIEPGTAKKGQVVKVTVTPNDGEEDGKPATAEVTVVNAPPTIDPIGDQLATEGVEFTLDLAQFISDPDGDKLKVGLEIAPEPVPAPQLTNMIINWTPTDIDPDANTFTVTITAEDDEAKVDETFTIEVENVNTPPVLSEIDDQEVVITDDPASGQLSIPVEITDDDGDQVMVQATSPDIAVSSIADALGTFNVTGTTYADSPLTLDLEFNFTSDDAGNVYTIKLFGNDDSGAPNGVDETSFSISVRKEDQAKPNLPPKLKIPDQKLVKSQDPAQNSFSMDLADYATDPEQTALTFEIMTKPADRPAGISLNGSVFKWDYNLVDAGVYIIPFKVTDKPKEAGQEAKSAQQLVTFNIIEPNFKPEIEPISVNPVQEGDDLTIEVVATDPNNDFLTLSAEGLPDWLIFDPGSLEFTEPNQYSQIASGTPPFDVSTGDPVTFDVTFIATDTEGESAESQATIEVTNFNRPPVVSGPDFVEVFEDSSVSFPVSAEDPDNDPLTWTKQNGMGEFDPDTLVYTLDLSGQFDLASPGQDGEDLVQIIADDGNNGTDQFEVSIAIHNTNQPVEIDAIGDQTVKEGEEFSIPVFAEDPDGDVQQYDWQSIPQLPFQPSFDDNVLKGAPGFEDEGVYNVTVTVTGNTPEDTANSSFVLTVENTNQAPEVNIPQTFDAAGGTRLVKKLSDFVEDPDGDRVNFELVDGPDGLNISQSGLLIWTPRGLPPDIMTLLIQLANSPALIQLVIDALNESQPQLGPHDVEVKITDEPQAGEPEELDATFSIDVALSSLPPQVADLNDVSVNAGDEVTQSISVTKILPAGADSTINLSVIPSEKGSISGVIDNNLGTFFGLEIHLTEATYSWQTTAEDAGQENISILAEDAVGGQGASIFTVTVGGNPPVIQAVEDMEVAEGDDPVEITFDTESPVDNAQWEIDSFEGDTRAPASLTPVASALFEWTPGFDETNKTITYKLIVKVTDLDSQLFDTETLNITVVNENRAPTLDPVTIDPAEPTGADDLVLNYQEPVDEDGDEVILKTVWKKDGETQPEYNDTVVVMSVSTLPGETWSVEAWAEDPFDKSDTQTAEVTIVDSPPIFNVKQTGTGKGNDPIVISATFEDPDGTPPVVSVNLEITEVTEGIVVSEEIPNSAKPASKIGKYEYKSAFKTGDYTYTVTADGVDPVDGNFVVESAPPVIHAPEVSGFACGNIPLNIGFEDSDGDKMKVELLYNGRPATFNGPTTVTNGTYSYTWDSNSDVPNATGETYTLTVVANDGSEKVTATIDVQLFNIVALAFVPILKPIQSPAPVTVPVEGGLGVGVGYDFDEPWWFGFLGAWNFSTSLSVNGQGVNQSPSGSFWHFKFQNVQLDPQIRNKIQAKYTYEYVYGVLWYDTSVRKWKFSTQRGRNSGQPSRPIYVTCDIQKPVVKILNPEKDGAVIPTKTPKLTAKVTDNREIDPASIVFDIDGSARRPEFNPDTGVATYTPPTGSPLGPGPHKLSVSAKDKAGNTGTGKIEFTVDPFAEDEVPPGLVSTTPANEAKVGKKRPVVSITVADAQSKLDEATIEVQLSSTAVDVTPSYTSIDVKSGTITLGYTGDLEDGEHSASLNIADKAGNAATFNWTFEIDTQGPTAPTLVVPESGCVAQQQFTVTGETEPGSKVKLILNGILYQEKAADKASGAYSFVDVPLSAGVNTLQAIPIDELGNLGDASDKKQVTYDIVKPIISVSSPNSNQIVSKLEVPISASINDNCGVDQGSIELSVNAVPVTNFNFNPNTGKLSFVTPTLPNNSVIPVTISAADVSGLKSEYSFNFETRVGIADRIPPVIDNVWVDGTPVYNGDTVTISINQPEITASVTDADSEIDKVDITINGGPVSSQYDDENNVVTHKPDQAQDDDTYNVAINATDTAETPNTSSFFFSYIIKTEIPKPTVQLDPDVERTKSESIGVIVSGVAKGVQAVWNVNGVPVFSYKFTGEVSYRRSVLLDEGENTIIAEVTDPSGISAKSDTVTVVKDTNPPVVNLISPVNADIIKPDASGVVDIEFDINDPSGIGTVNLQVQAPNLGTIIPQQGADQAHYSINANLDGIYTLSVTATDGVDNQTQPKSFSFTVDSTPPQVRIDSPSENEAAALPYSIPGLTGYAAPNDVAPGTIVVTIDNNVIVHAYNANSGQVYITPQEFEDGTTHTLKIEASDSVGNSSSDTRKFTIDLSKPDKTNPILASFFPVPGSTISGTSLSLLSFVASDSGGINTDLVTITINGKTFRMGSLDNVQQNRGTFTIFLNRSLLALDRQQLELGQLERGGFNFDPLELGALERSFGTGTNSISVQVSDSAGNVNSSSWDFNVVTEPPKVPVLDELPNVTANKNITITGTVEDVSADNPVKVSMYLNNSVIRTVKVAEDGKFTAEDVSLVNGENQISAKATDQAGNQSNTSTPVSVTLDVQKPQIALDEIPATTGNAILEVSGTVTDNTEVASINLIFNGESQELGTEASFSQELELIEGDNTIQIEAIDIADNIQKSAEVTINLDKVAPDTAPANLAAQLNVAGNAAKLSWNADENAASYKVYRSEKPISDATGMTAVLSNITATSATDLGLPVGKTVYYAITSVDAAGNEDKAVVSNSPNITMISSTGGTATLTDGTKARFGKMALSSNPSLSAAVKIEKLDDDAVPELNNAVPGTAHKFTAISQTSEQIKKMNLPITITIPYSADLSDSAESPQIRFLQDENWTEIDTVVDPEANIVTAKVSQLGTYRLVEIQLNPWDVKKDGQVNIFDLVLVGSHFGEKAQPGDPWDVKVDGQVNIFDLVLVGSHFGEVYGTNAAPAVVSANAQQDISMVAEEIDAGIYELRVETEAEIAGFQFELEFDSTQLELMNIAEGNATGTKSYWLEPVITSGSVKAASVALGEQQSLDTESAVLATAKFRIKGDLDSALNTIKINEIALSDDDGKMIQVAVDNVVKLLSDKVELRNALFANYPNPFNPETWIPYSVAQDSTVTVKIFNLLGQTVRKIDVGLVRAGEYISKDKAIYWDGKNNSGEHVASGVYFYQINITNGAGVKFNAIRKLVILK